MATKPPLQIIIVRHKDDAESLELEVAVERAFKGGAHTGGYVASGEDLGMELRKFNDAPVLQSSVEACMDATCHTVVVALAGPYLLGNKPLLNLVTDAWAHARQSQGAHTVLIVVPDDKFGADLRKTAPALASNQMVSLEQLGESALRPVLAAIRALHEARKGLAKALVSGPHPAFLTIFISHAKIDGLPLARSLKHLVDEIPWLKSFYDARDLAAESDWQTALESAATSSMLVILRTDIYEHRYWCQKEALWAEETAAPTVLVEARPGLSYAAGELPLERMPSVRIPDGNLFRVLNAALRESLRYLLFQRKIREMRLSGIIPPSKEVIAFSYPPSMAALLRACQRLTTTDGLIIYPDPPLRRGVYEAANALVRSMVPGAKLLTPSTLAVV